VNSITQDVIQNGERIVSTDEERWRKSIFYLFDCIGELVLRFGTGK
jgi:hypothetical protein